MGIIGVVFCFWSGFVFRRALQERREQLNRTLQNDGWIVTLAFAIFLLVLGMGFSTGAVSITPAP